MEFSLSQAQEFLNKKDAESVAHLTSEPTTPVKVMGRMTDIFGGRLLERIPSEIFETMGGLASSLVMPVMKREQNIIDIKEFYKVIRVINRADRMHYASVALMFTEGSAAGGVGSIASLGGPAASIAVALAELPINYLLLLRRLLSAQASFFVTPDLRNANRAFEMASATSIEAMLAAWSNDNDSMLSGMIARKLSAKRASKLASFAAHRITPLLPSVAVRSATEELSDAGTEQVTSSILRAGLRNYCQKHPQIMASMFPILGAAIGGLTSAMSAKRSLLINYHLSRLEYIQNVRCMLKIQPLLTYV